MFHLHTALLVNTDVRSIYSHITSAVHYTWGCFCCSNKKNIFCSQYHSVCHSASHVCKSFNVLYLNFFYNSLTLCGVASKHNCFILSMSLAAFHIVSLIGVPKLRFEKNAVKFKALNAVWVKIIFCA